MRQGEWTESHSRDEYISDAGIVGYRGIDRGNARWYNHMPAHEIKKLIGEDVWRQYFKFSVVRDPYDKVISHFYFVHKGNPVLNENDESILSCFRNWVSSEKSVVDRNKYLIDGELAIDYFIRFEKIKEGIQEVCEHLDLPYCPEKIPEFKKGQRPTQFKIQEMYDEKSKEVVEKRYQWEFDNLGYQKL